VRAEHVGDVPKVTHQRLSPGEAFDVRNEFRRFDRVNKLPSLHLPEPMPRSPIQKGLRSSAILRWPCPIDLPHTPDRSGSSLFPTVSRSAPGAARDRRNRTHIRAFVDAKVQVCENDFPCIVAGEPAKPWHGVFLLTDTETHGDAAADPKDENGDDQ
jgi:hypothetical protein